MNEQIKKIGKIALIVVGAIIALAVVAQILFKNVPSPMSSNYGGYSLSEEAGFGGVTSLSGSIAQKAAVAPSASRDYAVSDEISDSTEKKIRKNGQLSLYVKNVEDSVNSIKKVADDLKGEVISSNISKNVSGEKYGYVTIKVPVISFEEAMAGIKELATEVENESSDATDVTEQYVDLESQLKNLRVEEAQYIKIMDRAGTVEEILQVADYLSRVRGEIERIEGQLKYLDRQVDMSTIYVSLSTDADFEVWGIRWRPLIVAKRAVKSMLSGLADYADAMIKFIIALPVIILWLATIVIIIWVAQKLLRWLYRKFFKGKEVM